MKKCSRCSKPATLHITELRDGDGAGAAFVRNVRQDFLNNPEGSETAQEPETLQGKLGKMASEDELEELDQLACPNCGITFTRVSQPGPAWAVRTITSPSRTS